MDEITGDGKKYRVTFQTKEFVYQKRQEEGLPGETGAKLLY
jgi:hypothetical protein